jgi:hypothetical protein
MFWSGLAGTAMRRSASFCAEASVLVLVLAVLDRYLQRGRIELAWVLGAAAVSGVLLATSILLDHASGSGSLHPLPDH